MDLNSIKSLSVEMIDCYKEIYDKFYSFSPEWVNSSVELLKKNLSEMNIENNELKEKIIFNIGTGREVIAFHKLGAKKIFHADISDISVKNLNKLALNRQFSNIYSKKMDVCTDAFKFDKEVRFDLVYLNGVFHHLHSPKIFIDNLNKYQNENSLIFLRIYRSGSFGFFVTDFLRKIRGTRSWNKIQFCQIADELFPDKDNPRGWNADFRDDLMVPILNLFNTSDLEKYFTAKGFALEYKDDLSGDYDHSGGDSAIQGTTLIFKKLSNNSSINTEDAREILHIDQMSGINYSEKFIEKTLLLMNKVLSLCTKELTNEQVAILLKLYQSSQTYRIKKITTSEENHLNAQSYLLDFIKNI